MSQQHHHADDKVAPEMSERDALTAEAQRLTQSVADDTAHIATLTKQRAASQKTLRAIVNKLTTIKLQEGVS